MQFELMLAHRYTLCAVSLHCCTVELHCDKTFKEIVWDSAICAGAQIVWSLWKHDTLVRYARKHNVHVCNWFAMHGNTTFTRTTVCSVLLWRTPSPWRRAPAASAPAGVAPARPDVPWRHSSASPPASPRALWSQSWRDHTNSPRTGLTIAGSKSTLNIYIIHMNQNCWHVQPVWPIHLRDFIWFIACWWLKYIRAPLWLK